jgi:hypothetical protein
MRLVPEGIQQLAVYYLLMKPALIRIESTAMVAFALTSHNGSRAHYPLDKRNPFQKKKTGPSYKLDTRLNHFTI